jgi:FMN hydrolase / 5-amino-6-(5-phospho-D-ribitylamino)uracil phosphatase
MGKVTKIKIVSIDLFRTLIDVGPNIEIIMQAFLSKNVPSEKSKIYYLRADEILWKRWDAAGVDDKHFKSVRTILEDTYTELFNEINLEYDPKLLADMMIEGHKIYNVFSDAKPFLEKIGQTYPVCLSTDADIEMVEKVQELYQFDSVFISEELQLYKLNPGFFNHIIAHYNVLPENILHIGDSKSDIVAPKQLGIQTCWLNRDNHKWEHFVKPDFEVKSLLEILDILD